MIPNFKIGKNIHVYAEKPVDYGRIDIYIEGDKGIVAIENKIYAGDGGIQLKRYRDSLENKNKPYKLLYLTLDGHEASKQSEGGLEAEKDYVTISYRNHIIKWAENCHKEVAQYPTIRETIAQYIRLVKKLTGQMRSQEMNNEIIELIANDYQAAKVICNNFMEAVAQYYYELLVTIKKRITDKLSDNVWEVILDENVRAKCKGISIRHKQWASDGSMSVRIENQTGGMPWGYTVLGIVAHKEMYDRTNIKEKLQGIINKYTLNSESPWWPCFRGSAFPTDQNESMKQIFDNNARDKFASEIADTLTSLAQECTDILVNVKRI